MEPFSGNPRILSAATAVPPHRVGQEEIKGFARSLFAGKFRNLERLLPVFDNGRIETRHFCQPLGWYGREWSFPERNALYVEHALELSDKAARRCLDRAGVEPEDVGALFFVSTTGLSTPSLDAKLLFRLITPAPIQRSWCW
jgi:alkylresorcinol/alkylpyrone synthase